MVPDVYKMFQVYILSDLGNEEPTLKVNVRFFSLLSLKTNPSRFWAVLLDTNA